jgi:hypothetical protein
VYRAAPNPLDMRILPIRPASAPSGNPPARPFSKQQPASPPSSGFSAQPQHIPSRYVADFLGEVFGGLYRLFDNDDHETTGLNRRKSIWNAADSVRVTVPHGTILATHGGNLLTKLVLLAGDRGLRVELGWAHSMGGPALTLMMHDRRNESISPMTGHPTPEEMLATHRERYPSTERNRLVIIRQENKADVLITSVPLEVHIIDETTISYKNLESKPGQVIDAITAAETAGRDGDLAQSALDALDPIEEERA